MTLAIPEKDKTHVRHGRVANEQVQVFLAHGHESAVEDVAKAEQGEDRQPCLCALR